MSKAHQGQGAQECSKAASQASDIRLDRVSRVARLHEETRAMETQVPPALSLRESHAAVEKADVALPSIPGFAIHDEMGRGAMGIVYRATQLSLKRLVALKVPHPRLARTPLFVERLDEEIKALSVLNHPNIVTVIDRGKVGEIYYFAMEYVAGETLQSLLGGGFSMFELLQVAMSVVRALDYAHRQGIVHRDIKPANIMTAPHGVVKVMDFGLAGVMPQKDESRDLAGLSATHMGTPGYMSPEQVEDALLADGRSDIFSTGVVLYELACGQRPKLPDPPPPSQLAPHADPRLDPIIMKCLDLDPEKRYQVARDLLDDLVVLHAEVAKAPGCPQCDHVSGVRIRQCEKCQEDLSGLFEACADCGALNRLEVQRCLQCGGNLEERRKALADEAQHAEAVQRTIREGKHLFRAGDFERAIALWEGVKPGNKSIERLIEKARARREELASIQRSNNRMNGVLIVAAVVLLLTVIAAYIVF